jgi:hypothetical protein
MIALFTQYPDDWRINMKRSIACSFVLLLALVTPTYAEDAKSVDTKLYRTIGYVVKKKSIEKPTKWELETFNLLDKNVVRIKSVKPVKKWNKTRYRFVVYVERYATPDDALKRLQRILEMPPGLRPEEQKAFPLRKGFRHGTQVYLVTTDVALFELDGELERVLSKLQKALENRP